MKLEKKIVALATAALLSVLPLSACGGVQEEVESPVREATQQIEKARDVQQRVEDVQQRVEDVQQQRQ